MHLIILSDAQNQYEMQTESKTCGKLSLMLQNKLRDRYYPTFYLTKQQFDINSTVRNAMFGITIRSDILTKM